MKQIEVRRHTIRRKPDQHLSQAGVELARRVGAAMGPFHRVITSPIPRAFETAIAMGFAVDEQADWLSLIVDGIEDEIAWDAGFFAWAETRQQGGAVSGYCDQLAMHLRSVARLLPDDRAALLVTHGGIIEAGTVGCLPKADYAAWGDYVDYCEGVRLRYEDGQFIGGEVLRVEDAS